ncbi:DUF6300 family protein [Streptomyces sp. BK340]|uniref:DUF6300 family protein n=1 Tax=Streptomyces sp. BK340 TaxID=2572903 RepID=UPI0011A192D0|nr:DUF6300 family protein [Streptomyces sp. BK340]TVZ90405.1 hypothetical protein FB157_11162 [Streptomyces sp. BK340]
MRHETQRAPSLPPCTRCDANRVIISGQMLDLNAFGQQIVIQLCGICDADAPAGGPLVSFLREGGGSAPERMREFEELAQAWQIEAMAARGLMRMPGFDQPR